MLRRQRDSTMYINRADFIVWALVLLITTCFILTHAAPGEGLNQKWSKSGSRISSGIPNKKHTTDHGNHPSLIKSIEAPPTESSAPQPVTIEAKGTDKDIKAITGTVAPSEEPSVSNNGEELAATKAEDFLYFEIRKRIGEQNLSLSDIQDVLSQKDDEDQFMFTLADKLGYLIDGKYDDPHTPVIKSQKKKLIALLETKKTGFWHHRHKKSLSKYLMNHQ